MTRCAHISPAALLLALAAAAPAAPPVRFVETRDVRIDFDADQAVTRTDVYVSRDGGRSWRREGILRQERGSVWTRVPEDGRYDFFLVLTNAQNQSSPLPAPGAEPHARMIVDSRPPTLQLRAAEIAPLSPERHALRVQLTLIEENLRPEGMRVLLHPPAGEPIDIGPVTHADSELLGTLAAHAAGALAAGAAWGVEVIVTDLAGNRVSDRLERVANRLPQPEPPAETPAESLEQPPLDPLDPLEPLPDDDLLPGGQERVAALRAAAGDFRRRGHADLAIARLEQALALAPEDPDLLSELAGDLLSRRDTGAAGVRYEQALAINPDHLPALAGMALVATQQRDYRGAERHLKRVLDLSPKDPRALLRLGDVQQRLGDDAQAEATWRRILDLTTDDDPCHLRARTRLEALGRGAHGG